MTSKVLKMAKMCLKITNIDTFWTHSCLFRYLRGPLVAKLLHILVERVISFKMSTQNIKIWQELTSKMRKMWYNHENINMLKLKTSPNYSKSLILGSREYFSSHFNIFEKINSNRLMLQAFTLVNFFSIWHYIPIDNHWIDHSYQFWHPNPCMRHAAAHWIKTMCSRFTRKLLATKIIKKCLLVATKVPYKSQLTLDPCHRPFMP